MIGTGAKRILGAIAVAILAVYLVLAVTVFNAPEDYCPECRDVSILIEDESTNGFLSAGEIKAILERNGLYPIRRRMADVNPRDIEDVLKVSPFVSTAECHKTTDGCVNISVTQRLPIIRIKNSLGADYYVDDHGGVMPNSSYTSDLIIATGEISESFARNYLANLALAIMGDEFWRNQVEQVNVLPDLGIELVPRVGDHVVYLGRLPETARKAERRKLVGDFVLGKLRKLGKFYKYGLGQAGWNKYSYISIEFDNQIICTRREF